MLPPLERKVRRTDQQHDRQHPEHDLEQQTPADSNPGEQVERGQGGHFAHATPKNHARDQDEQREFQHPRQRAHKPAPPEHPFHA